MSSDNDDYDDDGFVGSGDEVQKRRLVISVDFGTTYTGIGFATPLGDTSSMDDIEIVMDWGKNMDNADKIPSVISYSSKTKEKQEANWGSDLAPEAVVMKHMKLRLDAQSVTEEIDYLLQFLDGTCNLEFENIKHARGMPDYTDKAPEDIVQDYLTKVFEHVLNLVEVWTEHIPTDIVVTIPVDWSYGARNSTYRAVTKAGFNQKSFPKLEDIMFTTEPEAAAMYTARYFDEKNEQFLKEDECFILVDAGGGTVDIVSYQVKRLRPLELIPIGKPTGEKCGSIFIDLEFKKWLRRLLTDRYYLEIDPYVDINSVYGVEGEKMRKLMADFDVKKKAFEQDSPDMFLDLPEPLNDETIEGRVDCGQITISNNQMREFFDPCVDDIVEMVKYHIRSVDDFGARVKNLFLIGGFGESKYLQEELRDSMRRRDEIELRVPDTSWTAVARGAVICGIEKENMTNLVRTSGSPKHYGIAVDESFSLSSDERDLDTNPKTGKQIARNQMRWLIGKGDVILSKEPTVKEHKFVVRFREDEPEKQKGSVVIYSYAEDKKRPTRLSNAKNELAVEDTLDFDLGRFPMSEFSRRRGHDSTGDYYTATIKLQLILTKDGLKSKLIFKDKPLATEGSYHGHHSSHSTGNFSPGMYGGGFGAGSGRGNSFGRRNDRGRLSIRDGDVGAGERNSGVNYGRTRYDDSGVW